MNDFVYIFKFRNGGITLNGAKSKFQTLFQTTIKDKNGNDVNALWYCLKDNSIDKITGNITLLKNLFLDAGQDYDKSPLFTNEDSRKNFFINNIVNVANSSLYSFIKIQSDL